MGVKITINRISFLILAMLYSSIQLLAQTDSLVFNNGDIIIGELKDMDRGVATFKTDYSDSDFKIEWDGVREIYTESNFLITLSNGERYSGKLESLSPNTIFIEDTYGDFAETEIMDIVYLKSVSEGFKNRLSASIDFGYSLTKANDLKQLSIRSNIGYLTEKWSLDGSYNEVNSTQENVEDIKRIDANVIYKYRLPNDWFLSADISFLTNTEQKIKLRTNAKPGFGKFIVHTNKSYWAFMGGLSFMNETFSNESPERKSLEGFVGTELNLFDIGDLNVLTNAVVYPGITESGRWRFDFKFDLKYDLPLDFYIKLGFSSNYDNQPTEGASDIDYVLQSSIGWEW